ncbi:MAG: hypothetical protein LBU50_02460 [Cellulomonas sp.]|jgi:predicted ferric reductase|nr:hypothetical protein [Cellulomonas sp.]
MRNRTACGPAAHLAITALIAIVWLVVSSGDQPFQNHVAELLGVESVWLMSSSVLMLTRSARIDRAFGDVEGTLWWHRVAGAVGIGLGFLHPYVLATSSDQASVFAHLLDPLTVFAIILTAWAAVTPTSRAAAWRGPLGWLARRGYDRWRAMHGILAVYLVIAMVHGVADSADVQAQPVLAAVYAAVCAAGLYALVEHLVVARLRVRDVPGTVVGVERVGADTTVVTIDPQRPVDYAAGQFAEVGVPVSGERPHPFTFTSAPGSPHLQVAVRSAGAGTARIVEGVAVGDRVTLGPARGLLRHQDAGPRQVWLAGGIGIAPFVSWVRDQGEVDPGHHVDLIWSSRDFETEPFVEELVAAALRHDWLDVHLHDTARNPRLTAGDVVTTAGGDIAAITVLACASPAMISGLGADLFAAGLPRPQLRSEAFCYR